MRVSRKGNIFVRGLAFSFLGLGGGGVGSAHQKGARTVLLRRLVNQNNCDYLVPFFLSDEQQFTRAGVTTRKGESKRGSNFVFSNASDHLLKDIKTCTLRNKLVLNHPLHPLPLNLKPYSYCVLI